MLVFRQQPISDRGIDAQIEIQDSEGDATGRLLALQIKTGPSYLDEKRQLDLCIAASGWHLDYWRRHSLPVILVLHDRDANISYWQVVSEQNVELTVSAWKIEVPFIQTLDKSAFRPLRDLAEGPIYERRLRGIVLDRPWMLILEAGERLFLEAEEWINKSSGRGSLRLKAQNEDGDERLVQDWPFVMFPGWPYELVFRQLFPWAHLEVDADFYQEHDELAHDDECGVWYSEDGRYAVQSFCRSRIFQRSVNSVLTVCLSSGASILRSEEAPLQRSRSRSTKEATSIPIGRPLTYEVLNYDEST